jgi:hypothetical protein
MDRSTLSNVLEYMMTSPLPLLPELIALRMPGRAVPRKVGGAAALAVAVVLGTRRKVNMGRPAPLEADVAVRPCRISILAPKSAANMLLCCARPVRKQSLSLFSPAELVPGDEDWAREWRVGAARSAVCRSAKALGTCMCPRSGPVTLHIIL